MSLTKIRLWTVEEYHRLIETGILTTEEQVELLAGQIIEMSPQNAPHAATTQWASDYLRSLWADKGIIRVQLPITLAPDSEPEPDIAIVSFDAQRYLTHHPTPEEIFLVIEVADTTLEKDRNEKAPIYFKAKIPEYWLLDVNNKQVHLFRQPGVASYRQEIIFKEEATFSLLAFPEIKICLGDLFP